MTTFPSNTLLQHQRLELVTERVETIEHQEDIAKLLMRTGMHRSAQETFWVVAYGPLVNVTSVFEVARGSYVKVRLHLPALLGGVMVSGSERFVLAHNHPSGDPDPTDSDVAVSRTVMEAANACQLYFEDHLILAADGRYVSLVSENILVPAPSPYDEPVAAQ